MPDKKSQIYYDGQCPLCTVFAKTVAESPDQTLLDVTTTHELPRDKTTLLQEIHLYEADGTLRTGPDAVLTALARRFTWLTPLAKFIRLPVIRTIAHGSYIFLSKRRKLLFGSNTARLYWLFLITHLGLLAGILCSWTLWHSARTYPLVPLFDFLPNPEIVNLIPFFLTGSLIVSLWLYARFRVAAAINLALIITLILFDQTRLQPWILHYALILGLLSFWQLYNSLRTDNLITAARLLVSGIYFWSGLQKLNTAFYLETFPWFTEFLWKRFGEIGTSGMMSFGLFVPFIEMAFALGLLTKRFRTLSIWSSLTMHAVVLICLGIGHNWNMVVWPWNIAMPLMIITLFIGNRETLSELFQNTKRNVFALVFFFLIFVLPIGNIFGRVDHYLAWSLYSGHIPTAVLHASPKTLQELNPNQESTLSSQDTTTLRLESWSVDTLGVVPYPEVRTFTSLFKTLCLTYPEDPLLQIKITERQFFLSHLKTVTTHTCHELPQPKGSTE